MEHIYEELRLLASRQMKRERRGHTLHSTALVHETFLRVHEAYGDVADESRDQSLSRERFLAIAASAMRRVLVDHARRRLARGGRLRRINLADADPAAPPSETNFLELDAALEKLAGISERQSRIVELRFFGGMSVDETARELRLSPRTVDGEWQIARDWLASELGREAAP
jgi:RNA polymerase sigma factor (TIGR02999 family)